jgi:ADP-heptose:LPS heptosyltransferase
MSSTPDTRSIRRILLVALDNLGDLVFTSALTPPLHTAFPGATIDVWCKQYTAPIAPLLPFVDRVIAADPFWAVPPHLTRPSITAFLRSIGDVRRARYDVAVVTGAPWRTAAAVAATHIPMRVGLARHRNQRFLTHVLPAENSNKPVLEEQARLLAPLGVMSVEPRYRLDAARLGDGLRETIAAQLPARFAALHPFASTRSRCVPLGEWAQLAFALHERGIPALWIGTSRELAELRSSHSHPKGFYADHLAGGSLLATAAALSLASIFVGHDSGPLHVAGAFGVPVVGIFAPGQPLRTFPSGAGPSRMIARPSPEGITAAAMLREIDALSSAT